MESTAGGEGQCRGKGCSRAPRARKEGAEWRLVLMGGSPGLTFRSGRGGRHTRARSEQTACRGWGGPKAWSSEPRPQGNKGRASDATSGALSLKVKAPVSFSEAPGTQRGCTATAAIHSPLATSTQLCPGHQGCHHTHIPTGTRIHTRTHMGTRTHRHTCMHTPACTHTQRPQETSIYTT